MLKHKRRWEWIKLYPDVAFYAYCNKCHFYYPASRSKQNSEGYWCGTEPAPEKLYPYCPYCGKKMLKPVDNIHFKVYNPNTDKWETKKIGDR